MTDRELSDARIFSGGGISGRFASRARRASAEGPVGSGASLATSSDSLLKVLWRSRWYMLVCILLTLGAGFLYIQTATPVYTSTSKLYLEYGGIRISQPYEAGSVPHTDRYLYTQAESLKSRPILAAALHTVDAKKLQTFAAVEIPVGYLRKNIDVAVGKKDEIISVSFESPYPLEAAQIVNGIVEAYMTYRSEHERQNSAQVLEILQRERERTAEELEEKRKALADFQANQMPLALGSDQGSGVMQRHLEFQAAHVRAHLRRIEAESFRRAVQLFAPEPDMLRQYVQGRVEARTYGGTSVEQAPLKTKLTELQLKQEELLKKLTTDHPAVAALCVEIERVETKLAELDDDFVKAMLAVAERQYVDANDHEEYFARLCEEQEAQVVMLNAEIVQYQRLQLEVDQLTQHRDGLEREVREIRKVVGEDVGRLRMAILEPALRGEKPSWPEREKVLAVALVFGLIVGGGIAVSRDLIDQTLRSADEISAALGLPVLGVVPAMSRRQKMQTRGQKVFLHPNSPEAEAFRTVRTAVFFSVQKDKAKTMLVTSPSASDGKSTIVSNLSIAIARAGQRTLILDADFRKPMQHAIFGVDHHERCLSSVFAGKMTPAQAVQPTQIEGLHLLTCGYGIPNPAELLNSQEFATLLKRLVEGYDRVVIDAPPVMAVTDAQILGAICDFTVLVLRADKSTRRIAQRAADALESVGARLLGVVVNEVRKSGGRYGYYGTYHGRYGSDSRNGGRAKTHGKSAASRERGATANLVPKEK